VRHPSSTDLALLAGGDCSFARAFLLNRHVRQCPGCAGEVDEFSALREEMAESMPPAVDWECLASEMRANVRLGLEAGACVRYPVLTPKSRNPRLVIAFASLVALIGTGVFYSRHQNRVEVPIAVLHSTPEGVEVRSGLNSLELLNRKASIADQTVGAQGQIGVRYVDDTGSVTINNVYLQ
jgi:anti-sigma factor ChrR (cupin superfamily)